MVKKESFESFKERANHSFSVVSARVEKIMRNSNLKFKRNSLISSVYKLEAKIGSLVLENQKDLQNFVKGEELTKMLEKTRLLNKKIAELEKEIEQAK